MTSLPAKVYDQQWEYLNDFLKYNPGSRHRRRLIYNILSGLQFSSVLDVGCGRGELLVELHKTYGDEVSWYGVDFAPQTIAEISQILPFAKFDVLSIEENYLPYKFDLIICSEVIEHINNQDSTFHNLCQMVKPGGYLLLTCPAGPIHKTEKVWGHVHHPELFELNEYASKYGVKLLREINWGWPLYRLQKFCTNLSFNAVMKHFGSGKYSLFARVVSHLLYVTHFFNLINCQWGCQRLVLFQCASDKALTNIGTGSKS